MNTLCEQFYFFLYKQKRINVNSHRACMQKAFYLGFQPWRYHFFLIKVCLCVCVCVQRHGYRRYLRMQCSISGAEDFGLQMDPLLWLGGYFQIKCRHGCSRNINRTQDLLVYNNIIYNSNHDIGLQFKSQNKHRKCEFHSLKIFFRNNLQTKSTADGNKFNASLSRLVINQMFFLSWL